VCIHICSGGLILKTSEDLEIHMPTDIVKFPINDGSAGHRHFPVLFEDYCFSGNVLEEALEPIVGVENPEELNNFVETKVNPYVMYTTTALNFRSGPGVFYEKILTSPNSAKVSVIATVSNGWSKIVYNDKEYYCSSKYLSKTVPKEDTKYNGKYGNIVKGEKGTADVTKLANDYWNRYVPYWLKAKFVSSGWEIIVSSTSLSQRFNYDFSVAGVTSASRKTIYIDNRRSAVSRCLVHELGHFVDAVSGYPSRGDAFKDVFLKESSKYKDVTDIGDSHHTSNSTEYFASVFRDLIEGDDVGNIPETIKFVKEYIG
jgi:uncharacterized protein YraI